VEHLRSTGLYAKAGTLIEIIVAKEFVDKVKVSLCLGSILGYFHFCIYLHRSLSCNFKLFDVHIFKLHKLPQNCNLVGQFSKIESKVHGT
jgi:hypothetical protein